MKSYPAIKPEKVEVYVSSDSILPKIMRRYDVMIEYSGKKANVYKGIRGINNLRSYLKRFEKKPADFHYKQKGSFGKVGSLEALLKRIGN